MSEKRIEVPAGTQWGSGNPWVLGLNVLASSLAHGEPCPHCIIEHDPTIKDADETWRCPRVLIVAASDGYETTGVCFDCAAEAVSHHDASWRGGPLWKVGKDSS